MECRLCLSTESLLDVFDSRFHNGGEILRTYIHLTTGVEILATDIISKKICSKCLDQILFIYKFRMKSGSNEKKLKKDAGLEVEKVKPIAHIIKHNTDLLRKISNIIINNNNRQEDVIVIEDEDVIRQTNATTNLDDPSVAPGDTCTGDQNTNVQRNSTGTLQTENDQIPSSADIPNTHVEETPCAKNVQETTCAKSQVITSIENIIVQEDTPGNNQQLNDHRETSSDHVNIQGGKSHPIDDKLPEKSISQSVIQTKASSKETELVKVKEIKKPEKKDDASHSLVQNNHLVVSENTEQLIAPAKGKTRSESLKKLAHNTRSHKLSAWVLSKSIAHIYRQYPNIILAQDVLDVDVDPVIVLTKCDANVPRCTGRKRKAVAAALPQVRKRLRGSAPGKNLFQRLEANTNTENAEDKKQIFISSLELVSTAKLHETGTAVKSVIYKCELCSYEFGFENVFRAHVRKQICKSCKVSVSCSTLKLKHDQECKLKKNVIVQVEKIAVDRRAAQLPTAELGLDDDDEVALKDMINARLCSTVEASAQTESNRSLPTQPVVEGNRIVFKNLYQHLVSTCTPLNLNISHKIKSRISYNDKGQTTTNRPSSTIGAVPGCYVKKTPAELESLSDLSLNTANILTYPKKTVGTTTVKPPATTEPAPSASSHKTPNILTCPKKKAAAKPAEPQPPAEAAKKTPAAPNPVAVEIGKSFKKIAPAPSDKYQIEVYQVIQPSSSTACTNAGQNAMLVRPSQHTAQPITLTMVSASGLVPCVRILNTQTPKMKAGDSGAPKNVLLISPKSVPLTTSPIANPVPSTSLQPCPISTTAAAQTTTQQPSTSGQVSVDQFRNRIVLKIANGKDENVTKTPPKKPIVLNGQKTNKIWVKKPSEINSTAI